MGLTWETITVALIVSVAAVWAARAIARSVNRKTVCTTCSSSGECPLASSDELQDLVDALPPSGTCANPPGRGPVTQTHSSRNT